MAKTFCRNNKSFHYSKKLIAEITKVSTIEKTFFAKKVIYHSSSNRFYPL